jgi:hypothetical protein
MRPNKEKVLLNSQFSILNNTCISQVQSWLYTNQDFLQYSWLRMYSSLPEEVQLLPLLSEAQP